MVGVWILPTENVVTGLMADGYTATSNRVLRVRYVALGTHRNYLIYLIRRHLPESLHLEYNI